MKQGCRILRVSSQLLTFMVTGSFAMLGLGQSAFGAQEIPVSLLGSAQPLDTVAVTSVPPLDYKAIAREDIDRQALGQPLGFAIQNAADINPLTHGTWEKIDATTMVWRLRVDCPNAVSMNLGFTDFFLPDGATLFLLNGKNHADFVRPITSADNRDFNEFWTPVVVSNDIVVELTIPEVQIPQLRLTIGSINAGIGISPTPRLAIAKAMKAALPPLAAARSTPSARRVMRGGRKSSRWLELSFRAPSCARVG